MRLRFEMCEKTRREERSLRVEVEVEASETQTGRARFGVWYDSHDTGEGRKG